MDWLEATQRLDSTEDDLAENNVTSSIEKKDLKPVIYGTLRVCQPEDKAGHEFQISPGDNLIGRDPTQCRITFNTQVNLNVNIILDIFSSFANTII
jgi:hypothetical protein